MSKKKKSCFRFWGRREGYRMANALLAYVPRPGRAKGSKTRETNISQTTKRGLSYLGTQGDLLKGEGRKNISCSKKKRGKHQKIELKESKKGVSTCDREGKGRGE